ncbi:hypothetical protein, partial [Staphylococcus hominis]
KVTAQRAENNQKNYKKDNFYIISIEIVFFHLSRYFMSRTLLFNKSVYINFNVKYKPSKVMNKTGRVITIPVLK